MSKVLVDRELLESLAELGEDAINRMGSYLAEKHGEQRYVDAARAILALPAEAEGVDVRKIVVDSLVGMIAGVTRMIPPAGQPLPDFIQAPVDRAVERINAALSAVTAERDRLQSQLAEAQANDRTAMGYLHDVRQLVGGSDFPEMVRNVARMADALPGCVELIETLSPFEGDVLRKAYAALAAKEA